MQVHWANRWIFLFPEPMILASPRLLVAFYRSRGHSSRHDSKLVPACGVSDLATLLVICIVHATCAAKRLGIIACNRSNGARGHLKSVQGRKRFYLTTHSTHFIYGYIASDIMVENHSGR